MKKIIFLTISILALLYFYLNRPIAVAKEIEIKTSKNGNIQQKSDKLSAKHKKQIELKNFTLYTDEQEKEIEKELRYVLMDKSRSALEYAAKMDFFNGIDCEIDDNKVCVPKKRSNCYRAKEQPECITRLKNCLDYQPSHENLELAKSIKDLSLVNLEEAVKKLRLSFDDKKRHICEDREKERQKNIVFCEVVSNSACVSDSANEFKLRESTKDNTYFCDAPEYYCIER